LPNASFNPCPTSAEDKLAAAGEVVVAVVPPAGAALVRFWVDADQRAWPAALRIDRAASLDLEGVGETARFVVGAAGDGACGAVAWAGMAIPGAASAADGAEPVSAATAGVGRTGAGAAGGAGTASVVRAGVAGGEGGGPASRFPHPTTTQRSSRQAIWASFMVPN
jgi:hypothetical protein